MGEEADADWQHGLVEWGIEDTHAMNNSYKQTLREIQRAKIREPRDDQYVDVCHWSKTGWAIWNKDGGCTCQPAKAPALPSKDQRGEHGNG